MAVHCPTSSGQFLQSSIDWIIQSQQNALHSHTSLAQFLQFSHLSIFPFPHNSQTHASAGQVLHVSRASNFPFQQHSHASCGQFKQVSQTSFFPFQQLENTQQFWLLYWGQPFAEFHGTEGQESLLSGIQSWSPSKSNVNIQFSSSTTSIEYFNKSDIEESQASHIQLLFISTWSAFQSNGQLSKEQTPNCFSSISTFTLLDVTLQSLFSLVINHIKFFFQSPSISSSQISGILSQSLSHL